MKVCLRGAVEAILRCRELVRGQCVRLTHSKLRREQIEQIHVALIGHFHNTSAIVLTQSPHLTCDHTWVNTEQLVSDRPHYSTNVW